MALKPVRPRLRNISNGVAKVQIIVPAGDEIEVSEEVAAQIAHQGSPLRVEAADEPGETVEPVKPKSRTRKRT